MILISIYVVYTSEMVRYDLAKIQLCHFSPKLNNITDSVTELF